MTNNPITAGLRDIHFLARKEVQHALPRIERFPDGSRVLRFIQVLGDDILALTGFIVFSILIFSISFTNLHIQTDRQWVSFIYSIGGDIGMHMLVTSITGLILSIRIKRGIRMDSLCDYLAILAGPKAQFSLFKWSRFLTMLSLILMNHLAEQAVNYGVPSHPSLNADRFERRRIIMAPLGGGVLVSGDATREGGKPSFRYFRTGLSILATDSGTDNSAFYLKNGKQLVMYHLPHDLFDKNRSNLVTGEFETLGYMGAMIREPPVPLRRCSSATSKSFDVPCERLIGMKESRFNFEVKNIAPPNDSSRTDIRYTVSLANTDEELFGKNWAFSVTLGRFIVKINCVKKNNSISCELKDVRRRVPGKDWIDLKAHEYDLHQNMASGFVNLISLNEIHQDSNHTDLAAKLFTAMHVRSSADDTTTGGYATLQVEELNFDLADAILTFSGPWWLRFLLSLICSLGALSLIGHLIAKPSVPSTLVSIIGCLGEVVTEHRATCISERKRAFQGLYENYDRGIKVIGGLAVGTDQSFESGDGIRLEFGAGPGARTGTGSTSDNWSANLAHFLIHTKDRVVPLSRLRREEIESLVIGYTRHDKEAVQFISGKRVSEDSPVIGYRRSVEGVVSVHKKKD